MGTVLFVSHLHGSVNTKRTVPIVLFEHGDGTENSKACREHDGGGQQQA